MSFSVLRNVYTVLLLTKPHMQLQEMPYARIRVLNFQDKLKKWLYFVFFDTVPIWAQSDQLATVFKNI